MKKFIILLSFFTFLFHSSPVFAAKGSAIKDAPKHKHNEPAKAPHEGGNGFQNSYVARPDNWKKESSGVINARKALNDAQTNALNDAAKKKPVWRNNRQQVVTLNPDQEKARIKFQKEADKARKKKEKAQRKAEKAAEKEAEKNKNTKKD